MEIVEDTPKRLVMVSRPWSQSLFLLGVALFFTHGGFAFLREGEFPEATLVIALTPLIWLLFFFQAQGTRLIFDRETGALIALRKRMIGQRGFVIPLSTIEAVRAERLPASRRSPWRYILRLDTGEPQKLFGARNLLVPGILKQNEAEGAAARISAWLDSARAAA